VTGLGAWMRAPVLETRPLKHLSMFFDNNWNQGIIDLMKAIIE
jgi:hypothetical protein